MTPVPEVLPELRVQVGLRLGGRRELLEAALLRARKAVFDATGVILPLIQLDIDAGMAAWAWTLSIGGESREGRVEDGDLWPEEASAITFERQLTDTLRPAAASFISRQLVEHYLDTLAADRPMLIKGVRSLVDAEQLQRQLTDRVQGGRSIRNLHLVFDELLSHSLT